MDQLKFIKQFTKITERQLDRETAAANFIKAELNKRGLKFTIHKFSTVVPRIKKQNLTADGRNVPAIATGLISGVIESNSALISSLISSQKNLRDANINFNPACAGISRSNHYFAPALAISRKDLLKVSLAKKVRGVVEVDPVKRQSENILVGNIKNPKNIIVNHYDSIGSGACDNASGVALTFALMEHSPQSLSNTLYVFAGNEELSYDQPIYWGHGYREFEKKFSGIMGKADKILVLDSLGNAPTQYTHEVKMVKLGFPIKNLEKWSKKIAMVYGGMGELMEVYHSDLDTVDRLSEKYLEGAISVVEKLVVK